MPRRGYDIAGNVLSDGLHGFAYDGENRIAQVSGGVSYIYDAEGRRVGKSDGTVYTVNTGGAVLDEVNGSVWKRSEVTLGGHHLATVNAAGVVFVHGDWLGTERARSSASGVICQTETSLPFGDDAVVTGGCTVASPDFLTGKPRDAETGLDDFGARYLSSQWGRWMSADWTAGASAVPYATLTNPQSLNLYAYVGNDPVDGEDADGHARYDHGSDGCAAYVSSCSAGGDYSDWASMALVDEQIYGHDLAATGGYYAVSAPNGGSYVGQTPASVITAVAMALVSTQGSTGRQPDGSYKAPTGPGSEIYKRTHDQMKNDSVLAPDDPDGQCVTATAYFSGVTRNTTLWRSGRHALELTDDDIGLAIATFASSGPTDSNGRYPTNGDQNSGIFMGRSAGGIWLLDQWPSGKAPSVRFLPTHDPNDSLHPDRSNNADAYYVIRVPQP